MHGSQSTKFAFIITLILGWTASCWAADLFTPTPETLKRISTDPEMRRLVYWANRAMKVRTVTEIRPDRGDHYSPWHLGTTFSAWMENLGYSYLVQRDKKYARKGAALLVEFCQHFPVDSSRLAAGFEGERGQIVYGLAMGWLFFHDFLSSSEQQLVEKTVAQYIDKAIIIADNPKTWWYGIHNYNGVMFGPAGIASLLLNDRPGYQKRLSHSIRILKRWIQLSFDSKGLPCEGSAYARYSAIRVMLFAQMLRDRGGENLFKTTKLGLWPRAYIAEQIPGTKLMEARNDAYYSSPSIECLFVSTANQDQIAEWIYQNWSDRGKDFFPLNRLLEAQRRPTPFLKLKECPKGFFFNQRGLSIWRTGWGKGDVMFSIESAPYLSASAKHRSIHAQADRGHFNLYAYGDLWAVDTGYANDSQQNPLYSRSNTLAHSCVLIDGKGQGRSGNGPGVSGKTTDFKDNGFIGYARTDNTEAYQGNNWGEPGAGVQHALRDTYFVRSTQGIPAYAIVFDDIQKDAKPHTFTWQMMLLAGKKVNIRRDGALITNRQPIDRYVMTPARGDKGRIRWEVTFSQRERCSLWGYFRAGGISPLDSDSFRLVIDGGRPMEWNINGQNYFSWQRITGKYDQRQTLPRSQMFDFSPGKHTIDLLTREKGAQVKALFLGNTPEATPALPDNGRLLSIDKAQLSGDMRFFENPTLVTRNSCAVYLDATAPVRMSVDDYAPANNSRQPSIILRLRGETQAVNPRFMAIIVPLQSGQHEPKVAFSRASDGTATATLTWPHAVDTINWKSAPRSRPRFTRTVTRKN